MKAITVNGLSFWQRFPVVQALHELDKAPRSFLGYVAFNVVGWQCVIGPALVLLARRIEMPPSWVGNLLSFTPLSMILVLFTVRIISRVGSKRLMFAAWLMRNIVICGVFLIPWFYQQWGPRAAWYVLMGSTLGFCLARAIGAGGWWPWLHELVPPHQRGLYFSAETMVAHLISVLVLSVQALILLNTQSLWRYLLIYAIGVLAGFTSLVYIARIPGGRGSAEEQSLPEGFASYFRVLSDLPYLRFLVVAALSFSCLAWFTASSVLYMRDILGLTSAYIMAITTAGSVGILLTIRAWGRYADYSGSAYAMSMTLIGFALAVLSFLALMPDRAWSRWAILPAFVAAAVFIAAFNVSANRANLTFIKATGLVGYTNAWIIFTAIALGVTPIVVGNAIGAWGLDGFRLCFGVAGIGGLLCAILCRLTVPDGTPVEMSVIRMLNPVLPIRTLARIAYITAGFHKSNRAIRGGAENT
ncbi:MAG: hypothetical protein R6V12_09795 [Candidatus Hydrogenedentota bacterium]